MSRSRYIRLQPGEFGWTIRRHSDEVSTWTLDWSRYIAAADTLSTVTTASQDVAVDSSAISGQTTTVTLSGGTSGAYGHIDVTITTSASETYEVRVYVDTEDHIGVVAGSDYGLVL